MKKVLLPPAVAAVLAAVVIGIRMLAGGGRAQPVEGDLLLDYATGDNTPTSVGTIDTGCQEFLSSAGTVRVDAIAVNANDWAGMDFVLNYPSPAEVTRPGPGDGGVDQNPTAGGDAGAGFDFVPADLGDLANTFGSQILSGTYDQRFDLNTDGALNIQDRAIQVLYVLQFQVTGTCPST